jgi:hypothetical protein
MTGLASHGLAQMPQAATAYPENRCNESSICYVFVIFSLIRNHWSAASATRASVPAVGIVRPDSINVADEH